MSSQLKTKVGRKPESKDKIDAFGEKAILDLVAEGRGYRSIACDIGVGVATLFEWVDAIPERSIRFSKAMEQASFSEDEAALQAIEEASDPFSLAKAREIAIHRRWRAKALAPKRYGDKVQTDMNVNVSLYDADQAKRMAELLLKQQ